MTETREGKPTVQTTTVFEYECDCGKRERFGLYAEAKTAANQHLVRVHKGSLKYGVCYGAERQMFYVVSR